MFCLGCISHAPAQVKLSIDVKTADGGPVQGAELSVVAADTTVLFAILPAPRYTVELPSAGLYEISIAHMAYEPYSLERNFANDTTLSATLECREAIQLEEVAVEAKAPRKVTATGEVFRLSQKAKKSGDPYRALSEISLLNVDIVNQKVTTNSGDELLVLIDGRLMNSGISPIDPKFIESVEVSEVVSARFLKMGVKKIINIKLRERPLYSYTDLRTRHDIPIREGFAGTNFEFGKRKFAVSGWWSYSYLHDDKTETERNEQSGDISRMLAGEQTKNSHLWEGNFMAKWVPTKYDYFSSAVKFLFSGDKTKRALDGQYVKDAGYRLKSEYGDKTDMKGVLAALYHEHTFKAGSILTTFLKYNYSPVDVSENLAEEYDNDNHETKMHEESTRNQYTLSADFDTQEQSYGDINIGDEFEWTSDKDLDRLEDPSPSVRVERWSNYTYLGYSNNWGRLFYMASAGLENLGVKVLGRSNVCWRPRAAASLSMSLPHNQSIRLAYKMDNTLPLSSLLFTFNHSTNPLLRIEGNPYLIPEQGHETGLQYNKDFKKIRFKAFANHARSRNIIEPYIYTDGKMQVQSYRNNGTYKESQIGGSIRFGRNNLILFAAADHTWRKFNGQGTKSSVKVNGYARWDFGNFFIYSNIEWRNRDYTAISTTEYENPVQAHVQIAWQATKQVYVSLGLPYFWGQKSQTTGISQAAYKSWQHDCFKGMSLRPWLLISWTLRRNAKEALPDKMPDL